MIVIMMIDVSEFDEELPSNTVTRNTRIDSPMSDGTIEEDFSLQLQREVEVAGQLGSPATPMVKSGLMGGSVGDYSDIAKHGIVEVMGDDKAGRKIIVVSACKLPSNKSFDSQRFLR